MDALSIIILVLLVCWAGGLGLHVGGSVIHLLLVVALVVLVVRVFQGRQP